MSAQWQGRVGRQLMLINAETALTARGVALNKAGDFIYAVEETIDKAQLESIQRDSIARIKSLFDADCSGAWEASVIRVGFAIGSGSEYDAEYVLESLSYAGSKPHPRPHAETASKPWGAILEALNERDQLAQSAPARSELRKRTRL